MKILEIITIYVQNQKPDTTLLITLLFKIIPVNRRKYDNMQRVMYE